MESTVPAEGQRSGCGRLGASAFFLFFLVLGLGFVAAILVATLRQAETYFWQQTECEIVRSEVVETGDSSSPYRAEVVYRYQAADGKIMECNRITAGPTSSSQSYSDAQTTTARYQPGDTTVCYVDPDQPSQAVLERGLPWVALTALIPLVFAAIGAGGLWMTWRAPRPHAEARRAISGQASSGLKLWAPIAFGGVFVLAGGAFFVGMGLLPWLRLLDARSWQETECTVLSSEVRSHRSDDGTTYSIDILYEYERDGRIRRSNQYSFASWSSSGYDSKAEVVAEHPPGTRTVCYVDPDDPGRAVLDRGLSWEYLIGLLPLIFVLAGAAVIRFGITSRNKQLKQLAAVALSSEAAAVAEILPAPVSTRGPIVLQPKVSPWMKVLGMILVAAFWNGIVSVFVWQLIESFRAGSPSWFLAVFLLPFVAIGLCFIGMIGYLALQATNPRPLLTVSSTSPRLGERVHVEWRFRGSAKRLTQLKIFLEGREEVSYRRGTSTHTDREVFAQLPIVETSDQHQIQHGTTSVTVPEDTMHSVAADNNKIVWEIKVAGEIPRWPDVDESFEVSVRPRAVGELT
jgi:hypothetical protein